MNKNLFFRVAILLLCVFLSCSVLTANAQSYSRNEKADGQKKSVAAESTYVADRIISADTLGLDYKLEGLNEVFCSEDGYIYLLCGNLPKIVVIDKNYNFVREIKAVSNGEEIDFSGANGIFVKKDSTIYIADTNNARILVLNQYGEYLKEYLLPESSLIPEDFIYQPSKIIIDQKDYMYVLAQGSYYGALMYSPKDEFMGFYGANTVKASALDTISYFWTLLTSNDAKYEGSMKTLPFSFVDFCVDKDGYMVTCSGTTETEVNTTGQIRKLSPGGVNILFSRGADGETSSSESFNFAESKLARATNTSPLQNLVSVDVDDDGFIYTVDKTFGKIYVYDSECNLLNAFGTQNSDEPVLGGFTMPVSLAINETDILVADTQENCITIFKRTEYGRLLHTAQAKYLKADYLGTRGMWEKIISKDAGCQVAYRGLAKLKYMDGDYKESCRLAKIGLDYPTYDLSHQKIVSNYIKNNFAWLIAVALIVLVGLLYLLIIGKKGKLPKIKNRNVNLALSANIHPFKAFGEIKEKNNFSLPIANVLLFIFFVVTALQDTVVGFSFKHSSNDSYNVLFTFGKTVGLVILWSVVNWLISSLFVGNGKLKEIYTVSCYCLQPLITFKVLYIILSWVLPASSASVLGTINTCVLIYVFFLLSVAIMEIHEYTFPKFLTTSIITVLGMILAVFIIFMMVILLQQLWNFIYSLYIELAYR